MRALAPVTTVPTRVLSSTQVSLGETPAFRRLQRRLQTEIAVASGARRHGLIADSDHCIQRERPGGGR